MCLLYYPGPRLHRPSACQRHMCVYVHPNINFCFSNSCTKAQRGTVAGWPKAIGYIYIYIYIYSLFFICTVRMHVQATTNASLPPGRDHPSASHWQELLGHPCHRRTGHLLTQESHANCGHIVLYTYIYTHIYTPFSDVKESLFRESSPENIEPWNFMGPLGPSEAHGPHGLQGWGTTHRELKVPSRSRYIKELRVLCREFRNSLTSEKSVYTFIFQTNGSPVVHPLSGPWTCRNGFPAHNFEMIPLGPFPGPEVWNLYGQETTNSCLPPALVVLQHLMQQIHAHGNHMRKISLSLSVYIYTQCHIYIYNCIIYCFSVLPMFETAF